MHSYFTLLNKMSTIIIAIIISVIGIIGGAVVLNKNNTAKKTSSSSSDIQLTASNGSTIVQPPTSNGSTIVQPPTSNTTVVQPSIGGPTVIYCLADGDWPKTEAGKTASHVCPSGYTGTMSRVCNADGSWNTEDISGCTLKYCLADGDWPKTEAGKTAEIPCKDGYGTVTRVCNADGSWNIEDTSDCFKCRSVNKDVSLGKTLITIHVQYSFDFKFCSDIEKITNAHIYGIYDFTFTANTNSIAEDYNKVKDTIPSKVFESIKSKVNDVNSKNDCKIGQGDINYVYPAKLNVFKNDEYLIIVSNHINEIETYSYDYPYNYINNSIVTLQSKTPQSIKQTDNILYKMWTHVDNYASDPACQKSSIAYVWGNTVTHVYANKYITFALILAAMLRDIDTTLTSLGNCKATFRVKQGNDIDIMLSKEPYCKGVYLLTDVKDSITNFCKVVNTWNGKGWTYTIDLNAEYQSTPTIYNVASKKDLSVFNTGSNLLTEDKYNRIVNKGNSDIPPVNCNHIDLQ